MHDNLENHVWWKSAGEDIREQLRLTQLLLEKAKTWEEKFYDYSFTVFPAAKAYEGYLKKIFLDIGFITEEDYYGRHFRLGKALNPDLEVRFRNNSHVYSKIVSYCGGSLLADKLWNTWKNSRNLVFHWFPEERNALTLSEAEDRFKDILDAIDSVFLQCKIELRKNSVHATTI